MIAASDCTVKEIKLSAISEWCKVQLLAVSGGEREREGEEEVEREKQRYRKREERERDLNGIVPMTFLAGVDNVDYDIRYADDPTREILVKFQDQNPGTTEQKLVIIRNCV